MSASHQNANSLAADAPHPPSPVSAPQDQDCLQSRVIDAPRSEVFKTWTDPQRMAQWWGPYGFTDPICEMDLHPGGAYRIYMRSTDGAQYPVLLEELDGKTRLTIDARIISREICAAMLKMSTIGG